MRAAIYCRVSTEDQEREGTSLQSQVEACKKLAIEKGFEVVGELVFLETYSGLSLERPKLNCLRELAQEKKIGAVIAYTLDRLSRDPVHFIILQEELERNGVEIILATESVDSTDLGKLTTYIKGFAAKLEAQKIRERTMRGLRERAKSGRFPSGRRARLFGYDYIPGKGTGEGVRYVNEAQAKWVREIFRWFVNDGLGIDRIAFKLRELDVPTPSGRGLWYASEVWNTLRNIAYTGQSFVFTQTFGLPKNRMSKGTKTKKTGLIRKPRNEWIEIPNATPPLISLEVFELAQAQLARNRQKASRNMKQEYMLSGHIRCRKCDRNYWGLSKWIVWGGQKHLKRFYRCAGKLRMVSPVQCDNHNLNADRIEAAVWTEIKNTLSNPDRVIEELKRKQNAADHKDQLEQELKQTERRLLDLDREQQQLLQWALKGFPEAAVLSDNERINKLRIVLKDRQTELTNRLTEAKQDEVDVAGIRQFCELAKQNLHDFSYQDKRLALEVLRITVWVDGEKLSMTGALPEMTGDIVSTRPA